MEISDRDNPLAIKLRDMTARATIANSKIAPIRAVVPNIKTDETNIKKIKELVFHRLLPKPRKTISEAQMLIVKATAKTRKTDWLKPSGAWLIVTAKLVPNKPRRQLVKIAISTTKITTNNLKITG